MKSGRNFVLAFPFRTGHYNAWARTLYDRDVLKFYALGTRKGIAEIPKDKTRLFPLWGLASYIAAKTLPSFQAESFRFWTLPVFDRWVKRQLQEGDHVISSFGYTNDCFEFVRRHGGKTLIDAGNSHPEHYWNIVEEEYERWECPIPPFPRCWYERSKAMMPLVDYVISPSNYVSKTFRDKGFKEDQILKSVYPVDLKCFFPDEKPREESKPLTLISTAGASLRKGTPYLLDAYRIIRKEVPDARLILTDIIHPSIKPLLSRWSDLPIIWETPAPHEILADRLRAADIFVLPSLEEGLVRTAIEAMACGLPVILTPHCGANDFVEEGVNGSVVPIRSPEMIAEKILFWWKQLRTGMKVKPAALRNLLSYETFAENFLDQLSEKKLL